MRDQMKAFLIGSTLILSNAILPLSAISAKHARGVYVSQSGYKASDMQCQAALNEATNTVEEVPSVQMSTMDIRSLAEEYSDFPAGESARSLHWNRRTSCYQCFKFPAVINFH